MTSRKRLTAEQRQELYDLIAEIYSKNGVGGAMHIVLDDLNVEDHHITYCIENMDDYPEEEQKLYRRCAEILLTMHRKQRAEKINKPDQIIHPYYFAEAEDDENCERKATCLWLIGVEPLKYEIKYKPRVIEYKNGKGTDSPWHMNTMCLPQESRAKMRSKTYPGIAYAMAEQWG